MPKTPPEYGPDAHEAELLDRNFRELLELVESCMGRRLGDSEKFQLLISMVTKK